MKRKSRKKKGKFKSENSLFSRTLVINILFSLAPRINYEYNKNSGRIVAVSEEISACAKNRQGTTSTMSQTIREPHTASNRQGPKHCKRKSRRYRPMVESNGLSDPASKTAQLDTAEHTFGRTKNASKLQLGRAKRMRRCKRDLNSSGNRKQIQNDNSVHINQWEIMVIKLKGLTTHGTEKNQVQYFIEGLKGRQQMEVLKAKPEQEHQPNITQE